MAVMVCVTELIDIRGCPSIFARVSSIIYNIRRAQYRNEKGEAYILAAAVVLHSSLAVLVVGLRMVNCDGRSGFWCQVVLSYGIETYHTVLEAGRLHESPKMSASKLISFFVCDYEQHLHPPCCCWS